MLQFENEKVRLRAPEYADLDLLYLWENDPEVRLIGDALTPYSMAQLEQYLQSEGDLFGNKQLRLMIEIKDDKVLKAPTACIGTIDLFDFNPYHQRAGIGILIYDPLLRGKGYGTAALQLMLNFAFVDLQLHQVYASTATNNNAIINSLIKCGFEQTATRKNWLYINGSWQDEILYQCFNNKL